MIMGLLEGEQRYDRVYGQAKAEAAQRPQALLEKYQAIFQDPFSSFNLFYKVEKLLLDCIKLQGDKLTKEEQFRKMKEACSFVNLKFEELHNKYPFELSGGQMQRLMIARIFMLHPKAADCG